MQKRSARADPAKAPLSDVPNRRMTRENSALRARLTLEIMIAFVTLALSFQASVTCHTATLAPTRAATVLFSSHFATTPAAAAASCAQSTHAC